ncbi:MAG TPA: hypothetical protein PKD07_12305 [Microthrixaceae bacterium]|nr:hypothetical protein [Microthrixaceae bacterium]
MDALLGPADDETTASALAVLRAVDPADAELLTSSKEAFGSSGFVRAVITATKEPVSATIVRGLFHGVRRFGGRKPRPEWAALRKSLADAVAAFDAGERALPSNRFIRDSLIMVSRLAPVLLVIDEFGKNLEAFADSRSEADLFLLQELVEWSHAPADGHCPVVIVTMQHLAFDEYLDTVAQALRREWAKVQGRFEDIPYIDTPTQTRHLIAQVHEEPSDKRFVRKRDVWARECSDGLRAAGLSHELDRNMVERTWPLHPTSLLVLPELCARYGQNERTLFSFLASSEPHGVPAWLVAEPVSSRLKDIRLDQVYDYFVDSAATAAATSQTASRWVEVETAVRDATGLSEGERRVLKAVGLLNLVSAGGAVRASRLVLQLSCADGRPGTEDAEAVDAALDTLEATGRITYREFADEYRLWRGSDLDLRAAVESARRRLRQHSAESLLTATREMLPVVAARHSTESGTLRVFDRVWDSDGEVDPLMPSSGADGLLVYVVGPVVPRLIGTADGRPVVAVRPQDTDDLLHAALELASIRAVLRDESVVGDDWVARRELAEREAEALATFDAAFESTVGHRSVDAEWWRLDPAGGEPTGLATPPSVTAALSLVCDDFYNQTPPVPNEMLNRHELTSQGAKARRLLIEGLLTSMDQERFGFVGFPPERAMYDAVFGATGIHREVGGHFEIAPPTQAGWAPAWNAVERLLDGAKRKRLNLGRALSQLAAPPVGLKAGVAPVLVVAGIVANRDEIALYEHGTYRPRLTPDVAERLLRNPAHFEVKHFASTTGARREVLGVLADQMDIRSWRNAAPTVISVVAHLVGQVNSLSAYGRQTRNISAEANGVRRALLEATEPDVILFQTLPALFDLPALPATGRSSVKDPTTYGRRLGQAVEKAMAELRAVHAGLLTEVEQQLAQATRSNVEDLRQDLSARAARVEGKVLDPHLRALLSAISDDQKDREGWLEYVAMVVSGPPASSWDDDERLRFLGAVKELGGKLRRIEAIHIDDLATDGEPFEATRHTLTRSDGTEWARVVASDERVRARLGDRLDNLLETLADELGDPETAFETVLARLADIVFGETPDQLSPRRPTVGETHGPASNARMD